MERAAASLTRLKPHIQPGRVPKSTKRANPVRQIGALVGLSRRYRSAQPTMPFENPNARMKTSMPSS
jgi:hypothetical protein